MGKKNADNQTNKNTPTFCQKHSGHTFASRRNGRTPIKDINSDDKIPLTKEHFL